MLVVEDEPTIARAVADRLAAEGFGVRVAHDGPSGVEHARAFEPRLVVLDVMLPGFDGQEVCRRVQAERPVPVLMLTARDDETDLLVGLGVGADDYVTKPFSMRELVARIRAVLRRAARPPVGTLPVGMAPVGTASTGTASTGTAGTVPVAAEPPVRLGDVERSEEHTSELQSRENLVCRLLLEKKKKQKESNQNDEKSRSRE